MSIEKVGKLIAQERRKKDLTQNSLAQLLGVSGKAVSKWERGLNYPDISLLESLAKVLDLTVAELLNGERNTESVPLYDDQINHAVIQTLDFSKKIVNRQRNNYLLMLILVVVLFTTVFLTTNLDTKAPVIQTVNLKEGVISVYATDNREIDGYLLTRSSEVPLRDNEEWQSNSVFPLTQSGRYYLWVKDKSGNIVGKPEYFIYRTTSDQQAMLMNIYIHPSWLTPALGIVTIDSIDYDRATLKVAYGDLYRFVEPITNEEIESRFRYLAWWSVTYNGSSSFDPNSGLLKNSNVDALLQSRMSQVYKTISTSKDPKLSVFSMYFRYISESRSFKAVLPKYFDCRTGVLCISPTYIGAVNFEDKDYFVRNFTWIYENLIIANRELGLDLHYFWNE